MRAVIEEGPCIKLVDKSGQQVFYTGRKQLNKIRKEEIRNPQDNRKKTTLKHTQPRRVGTAAVTNCYIIIALEYTQAQHKPTGAKSPLVTSQRYLKIKEQQ